MMRFLRRLRRLARNPRLVRFYLAVTVLVLVGELLTFVRWISPDIENENGVHGIPDAEDVA